MYKIATLLLALPILAFAVGGCPSNQDATHICVLSPPYYGSGSPVTTTASGTFAAGTSGTVASCTTFAANQGVYIAGAGAAAVDYIGTVVSCSGTTLTITPATSTSVATGTLVQHDESAAGQAAINALATTGGTIFFPDGTYNCNGPLTGGASAVLTLPNVVYGAFPVNIAPIYLRLTGFTRPTGATTNGAIIQTLKTSGNLIAGYYNAGALPPFTNVWLAVENLTFRAPQNPGITMVNAANATGLLAEHLWFDVAGTGGFQSGQYPTLPTNANGVGLVTPRVQNNVSVNVDDVTTYGYYTGINIQEHAHVKAAYALFNVNGFMISSTGMGSLIDHIWCQQCTNTVIAGSNGPRIHTKITLMTSEAPTAYDIVDPNNYLEGYVTSYFGNVAMQGGGNLVVNGLENPFPPFGDLFGWYVGTLLNFPIDNLYTMVNPSNQRVTITPRANITGARYNGYTTTIGLPNFTGRTISAQVFPLQTADTLLMVGIDSTHWVALHSSAGNIYYDANGTLSGSVAYSPLNHAYWRLREASGVIYGETSPDRVTWTGIGSSTPSWAYTTGTIVSLSAGTNASIAYPGFAEFDRFSVQ